MANRSPNSIAQQRLAQSKWRSQNLERIVVNAPAGKKAVYKEIAARRGVSLNRLILDYLDSLE